ncbi:hypothetical protein M4D03_23565 [Klebsiella pneumoniae]|nr:hypothetical protein [Klebsiella pneumoniae]
MVKDLDYIKGMLGVFLAAKTPFISTKELASAGYAIDSRKGMFHYLLLIEQGYISNKDLITNDIGKLGYIKVHGQLIDMGTDVRLSSQGQEFAQALSEPTVFEKLKSMSDAPMSTIKDVGLELTKAYLKKKFGLE